MSRRKKRNSGNGEALAGKPPVVKRKQKREPKQVDQSAWMGSWAPEARSNSLDIWPEHARPKRTTAPPEPEQ